MCDKNTWLDIFKTDEMLTSFRDHAPTIESMLNPVNNDPKFIHKIDGITHFPIFVSMENSNVLVLHSLHPERSNPLLKTHVNARAIAGFADKGTPMEFKEPTQEDVVSVHPIKQTCILKCTSSDALQTESRFGNTNITLTPYVFAPLQLLEYIKDFQTISKAADIFVAIINGIISSTDDPNKQKDMTKLFATQLHWLANVYKGEIPTFRFIPITNSDTLTWFNTKIEYFFPSASSTKRKNIDLTEEASPLSRKKTCVNAHETPREPNRWDRLSTFTKKTFLFMASNITTPDDPPQTLLEIFQCQNSKLALRLMRSLAGRTNRSFWAQPNCINLLLKGLIISESMAFPEGLNPFETPACPDDYSLTAWEEEERELEVEGFRMSTSSSRLTSRNGKRGKADFITPRNISEMIQHIKNFNFLILMVTGENSFLYRQWTLAREICEMNDVDLRSLARHQPHLPSKILWYLHLRTQAFLKSCSMASATSEVETEHLEWGESMKKCCMGFGSIYNSAPPDFVTASRPSIPSPTGSKTPDGKPGRPLNNKRFRISSLFSKGTGAQILDAAKTKNLIPPKSKGSRICLQFHLLGSCNDGDNCPDCDTHDYLPQPDFVNFRNWIEKNDLGQLQYRKHTRSKTQLKE